MLPGKELATALEPVSNEDDRRVRAVLGDVLLSAADDGDTILPLDEALRRSEKRFAHERRCLPDPVRIDAANEFYSEMLAIGAADKARTVALRNLSDDERIVSERIRKMVEKSHDPSDLDWRRILDELLRAADKMGSDDEERA